MHASVVLYSLVALGGVMASPVQEPEVKPRAIERRMPSMADIPFPRFPTRNHHHVDDGKRKDDKGSKDDKAGKGGKGDKGDKDGENCSSDTNTQLNACTGGNPYCCSSDGKGGHNCLNTTACQETIICCNNNNGFQICIGDIDFNVPITINIYQDDD